MKTTAIAELAVRSFYYSRVKDVRRSSNRKDVRDMTSPT